MGREILIRNPEFILIKSFTIVILQLACAGFLMVNGQVLPENKFLFISEILLLLIGLWSALLLNKNFSVLPVPAKSAVLVTSGPYKYVRHPIYTVVILLGLIWITTRFTVVNISVLAALIIIFIVKLNYEEKLLSEKFVEYKNYMKNSKKLIPFIY
ncbi:MAG: isoprenylcysteine carboxylmethyltransferase family protein [Bacteroidetes bacterium]|nr:isoprenylcysteine carboxylmethyltransferase family protein [Bacteroidota bacterium]